jgi:hypothetical protein
MTISKLLFADSVTMEGGYVTRTTILACTCRLIRLFLEIILSTTIVSSRSNATTYICR